MAELRAPSEAQLHEAREALLALVLPYRYAGEAPQLWQASVEALRRIEDRLGMDHTIPNRDGRHRRGREAAAPS